MPLTTAESRCRSEPSSVTTLPSLGAARRLWAPGWGLSLPGYQAPDSPQLLGGVCRYGPLILELRSKHSS